jgi:non-specific serine/threonine protein kinase
MRGDLDRAQELCARSLSLSRSIQDRMGMWIDLLSLGFVAYLQRDAQRAATLLHEGLHLQKDLRTTFGLLDCFQLLAGVAVRSRQPEHAARLLGAADRLSQSLSCGLDWLPAQRQEFSREVAATRGELGDAAFLAAWAEGCSWEPEQAIDYALAAPLPGRGLASDAQARRGALTTRELQVARLVAQGFSNRQIAEQLVITERTVGAHVEHILDKLNVSSRTQIGVWAFAHLRSEPAAYT